MNNNPFLQQVIKTVRRIQMQPRIRDVIRERLAAYADLHAVPHTTSPTTFFSYVHLSFLRVGAALLVLAISTGGLAYASEDALPGQPLYHVKVAFVEPLESAILITPKSRATWNAILAERRLTEAAGLESTGTLTPEARTTLEERFAQHVARASLEVEEVEVAGDVEVALALRSDLEARLSAHTDIFGALSEYDEVGNPRNEAGKLYERVAIAHEIAARERIRTETRATGTALAYDSARIDATAALTEEVERLAQRDGEPVSGAIEDRLSAARGALAIARTALAGNESTGAYVAAQTATRLTQEAAILNKNRNLLAIGQMRAAAKAPIHATTAAKEPVVDAAIMTTIMAPTTTEEVVEEEEDAHSPSSEETSKHEPSQNSNAEDSVDIQIGPIELSVPTFGL